jgi:hypothetical protein
MIKWLVCWVKFEHQFQFFSLSFCSCVLPLSSDTTKLLNDATHETLQWDNNIGSSTKNGKFVKQRDVWLMEPSTPRYTVIISIRHKSFILLTLLNIFLMRPAFIREKRRHYFLTNIHFSTMKAHTGNKPQFGDCSRGWVAPSRSLGLLTYTAGYKNILF